MVYSYLTGPLFRHHIGARPRTPRPNATVGQTRSTAQRRHQRQRYGDLQGIAGQAMPEIKSLNMLTIENKAITDAAS